MEAQPHRYSGVEPRRPSCLHLVHDWGANGPSIVASRYSDSLRLAGFKSKIFDIRYRKLDDRDIGSKWFTLRRTFFEFFCSKMDRFLSSSEFFFNRSWLTAISRYEITLLNSFDLIFVYWIPGYYLHYLADPRITARIVVRLSDDWFLTGGCHYRSSCSEYLNSCSVCPRSPIFFRAFMRRSRALKRRFLEERVWRIICSNYNHFLKIKEVKGLESKCILVHTPYRPSVERRPAKVFSQGKMRLGFIVKGDVWSKRKGLDKLLVGLSLVSNHNIELMVVGRYNRGVTVDPYWKDRVRFIGSMAHDDLPDLFYKNIDVLVIPSLHDNLPNVGIEAMSMGIPVLASRASGFSEYSPDENMLIFDSRLPRELANKLLNLSHLNEDEYKRLSARTLELFEDNFGPNNKFFRHFVESI